MNKSSNLQSFLIFLLFMVILIIIGKVFIDIVIREEGLVVDRESTEVITSTEQERLSWEVISSMILTCQVDQVFQGHDLRVSIVTIENEVFWGYEPRMDEILTLANIASEDCSKQIIQVVE